MKKKDPTKVDLKKNTPGNIKKLHILYGTQTGTSKVNIFSTINYYDRNEKSFEMRLVSSRMMGTCFLHSSSL